MKNYSFDILAAIAFFSAYPLVVAKELALNGSILTLLDRENSGDRSGNLSMGERNADGL